MSVHTLSHLRRKQTAHVLAAGAIAWPGMVAATFLAEVLWRGLQTSEEGVPAAAWPDGIIAGWIVLAAAWFSLRNRGVHHGPASLGAVGALWVLLSVLLEYGYRIYAVDHPAMRFLMNMFLGDYRGSDGWLWDLFVAVQLCAPLMTGALRETLARRRTSGRRQLRISQL